MLNLEDFMNIRDLKQQGWSLSAIADELHLDRKTVRKHLLDAPQPYKRENPAPCKVDAYRAFLRERWEKGVHNAHKLLEEIRGRGYDGGYSQLKLAVTPWREEGRERAFVRFETGPGEHYGKSRVMVRGGADPSLLARISAAVSACTLHNALQSFEPLDEAR
jgi:transposase